MPALHFSNISFSYAHRRIIEGLSLHVGHEERACIVGPNGSGKSTLLKLASGELVPEEGEVIYEGVSDPALLRVPKAMEWKGSVDKYLEAALAPIHALSARFEEVTAQLDDNPAAAYDYELLLNRMMAADVWSLPTRLEQTLAGLGLGELLGARPMTTLSPGQRMRLELAAILLVRPPILLLDEPTNHLDDAASEYLASVLKEWPGPVLMISHDRAFIDSVATVIYDRDLSAWQALATARGEPPLPGVFRCAGNYSEYLTQRQCARSAHHQLHAKQQAQKQVIIQHRRSNAKIALGGVRVAEATGKERKFFADRAQTTATKRNREDDRRLERLANVEVRKPRGYELRLPQASPPPVAGLAVSARNTQVEGRLSPVSFDLAHGEHLLVTGSNGSGKTTLLKWIYQQSSPKQAVALVPQRLPKLGDPGFDQQVWTSGVGELGKGLVHPAMWRCSVDKLSDGNQRRVQLALALAKCPSLLLIDEPTNYLDLATLEALEEGLRGWGGTLVVASHDRWLIEHWQGRRLHLVIT